MTTESQASSSTRLGWGTATEILLVLLMWACILGLYELIYFVHHGSLEALSVWTLGSPAFAPLCFSVVFGNMFFSALRTYPGRLDSARVAASLILFGSLLMAVAVGASAMDTDMNERAMAVSYIPAVAMVVPAAMVRRPLSRAQKRVAIVLLLLIPVLWFCAMRLAACLFS